MFNLGANLENLTYTGSGAFIGNGNGLDNVIRGGAAGDTLTGGVGNDTLIGGTGTANTLIGGVGDDTYVVSANDTIVELNGGGTDTIRTDRAFYTLNQHVENLTYTGSGVFDGRGNALDNVITGGAANDFLSGGQGNDTLNGGGGTADVVVLSGNLADYTFADLGGGSYQIIDTVGGRDGTDVTTGVERVRFATGGTVLLSSLAGSPTMPEPVDKIAGGPQVLPGLTDDDFILSGKFDGPEVLPVPFDEHLPLRLSESGQFDVGRPMDAYGHPLVVDAPWGVQMRAEWAVGVEPLQLSDNATQTLTYGVPGAQEPVGKAVGEDFGGPLVSSLMDYPEILPGLDDIFLTLAKDGDLPLVLPGVEDPFADLFGGLERLSLDRGSDSPWRMLSLDQASTPGDISGGTMGTRDHSGWNHDAWLV